MFRLLSLGFAGALIACTVSLRAQGNAFLDGYVTRTGTPQDFDVSGVHVACNTKSATSHTYTPVCVLHDFGEHVILSGDRDKQANTIAAKRIELVPSAAETDGARISGEAVIDGFVAPTYIRADGFLLKTTPESKVVWKNYPAGANKASAGDWVQFSGKRFQGIVQVSSVTYYKASVAAGEKKLRDKNTFDAAAVTAADAQTDESKFFTGTDYKRIPAIHDATQQARIDSIGQRLIPAFQKNLPDGDPNKLAFRFQLVDSSLPDCITMPSGIILVPAGTVGKLEDGQLAAVLADNIASAIERQTYRSRPASRVAAASNIAGTASLFVVPGVGLVPILGGGLAASTIRLHMEEQSGRVSLIFLRDAGFDPREAPLAWWRLSNKKADFMTKPAPDRATYLFDMLSDDWGEKSPLLSPVASDNPN